MVIALSYEQYADEVGLSHHTVRARVREGRIKRPVNLGHRVKRFISGGVTSALPRKEVAQILAVSEMTVMRLIRRGVLEERNHLVTSRSLNALAQ